MEAKEVKTNEKMNSEIENIVNGMECEVCKEFERRCKEEGLPL